MIVLKKYWKYIIGALVGAIGGYLYWKFVGCSTGTCPITSSAPISTVYGALLGGLFGGLFQKKKSSNE